MPRLTKSSPKYRKHSSQDCGFVCLDGKRIYFPGKFGSDESLREYHRTLAEWNGRNRPSMPDVVDQELTVEELIAHYWLFAEKHYRKNGEPTKELDNIKYALRPLKELYLERKVAEFGPLCLKALQAHMMKAGLSRGVINSRVNKIRRMFRWAVSEQYAPPSLKHSLDTVSGLQRGRTDAREAPEVLPVADHVVESTLPHLSRIVKAMVQFQQLTGCRPSEVCLLRPCDVDRSGDVWIYKPSSHKNEHHGIGRTVAIGPKAQAILLPFLLRPATAFCFSPAEAEAERKAEAREKRKTKVQPSQLDRRTDNPKRKPGARYTRTSYLWAVRRACSDAFPEPEGLEGRELSDWRKVNWWSPNQLRHSAATRVRKHFGLEAAQVTLGHTKADTTQIYAERNLDLALTVARQIG